MSEQRFERARAADRASSRLAPRRKPARRPSEIYRKMVATGPPRAPRFADIALIAGFVVAISLPLLGMLFSLDRGFVLEENTTLASRPKLKLHGKVLARYPARFETYFNDQFGFRKRLIYWLNVMKVAALGVSPTPKVVFGSNGWLYYGDQDVPYYRAVCPLSDLQLERWQERLEKRQAWLADRGIPYLVVFAPLKSTVYPEYMPRAYNRVGTVSRLDQLLAHLKAHSDLTVVDLRGAILDEKSRNQVFYRTDTHWNNRGAYVGYKQIIEALARPFPQLEAVPISAFEEYHYSEPGRDLPLLLGMRPYFWDRYVDLRMIKPALAHEVNPSPPGKLPAQGPNFVYEHPDKRLPRAVVFRDSFAIWLIPLLSENFSRVLYSWQYTLDGGIVEREQPDVVIQEMVERSLMDEIVPSP
jgi:alginate O-acetyltransferase complex protein AlgJ